MEWTDDVTVTCERSDWPIAHLIADGAVTHDGTRQLIEILDGLLGQPESFALMMEARNPRGVEVPHIREWAAFLEKRRAEIESRLLGVAFVLPSPMMRGALKVLFTWVRPPFEYAVVDDEDAGLAFLAPLLPQSHVQVG